MENGKAESDFLWNLFHLHLFTGNAKKAFEFVNRRFEQALDFPEAVELLLSEYSLNGEISKLQNAALVLVKSYYFCVEKHTILLAYLVEQKLVKIDEASNLLEFTGIPTNDLPNVIQKVLDVNWLISHDKNEGILNPNDDALLSIALHDVFQARSKGSASH